MFNHCLNLLANMRAPLMDVQNVTTQVYVEADVVAQSTDISVILMLLTLVALGL
jgi:hypothetical protein